MKYQKMSVVILGLLLIIHSQGIFSSDDESVLEDFDDVVQQSASEYYIDDQDESLVKMSRLKRQIRARKLHDREWRNLFCCCCFPNRRDEEPMSSMPIDRGCDNSGCCCCFDSEYRMISILNMDSGITSPLGSEDQWVAPWYSSPYAKCLCFSAICCLSYSVLPSSPCCQVYGAPCLSVVSYCPISLACYEQDKLRAQEQLHFKELQLKLFTPLDKFA